MLTQTLNRRTKVALAAMMVLFPVASVYGGEANVKGRVEKAVEAIRLVVSANEHNNITGALSEARCIGVVPALTEGALIAGMKRGHGVATCKISKDEWSAPAFFTINGASLGAQIGIQQKSLVILATNDAGRNRFFSGDMDLDATSEANAEVTVDGRSARRSWGDQPIVTYESSSGLFAAVNMKDTSIQTDDRMMEAAYGPGVTTRDVLVGKVVPPEITEPFVAEVKKAVAQ